MLPTPWKDQVHTAVFHLLTLPCYSLAESHRLWFQKNISALSDTDLPFLGADVQEWNNTGII